MAMIFDRLVAGARFGTYFRRRAVGITLGYLKVPLVGTVPCASLRMSPITDSLLCSAHQGLKHLGRIRQRLMASAEEWRWSNGTWLGRGGPRHPWVVRGVCEKPSARFNLPGQESASDVRF